MVHDKLLDDEIHRLQEQTEQRRLELLRIDLDLCGTLADLAGSEIGAGNHEHAAQTFARAAQGYVAIQRIFGQRKGWDEDVTKEINAKLAKLRRDLDALQRRTQLPNPT